jgi:hypothetical protein
MSEEIVTSELVQTHTDSTDTEITQEEKPKYSDIETKAMSKGWKPKDQYHGNDEDFTEAEDFMRNYTWVKEIKKLNKNIDEKTKAIDMLVEHNKKVEEAAYKKAFDDLNRKFDEAVTLGDTATAKSINEQLIEMKTAEATKVIPRITNDHIAEFQRRNPWFNNMNDPITSAMTAYARQLDSQINARNPGISVEEELRQVEEAVKKEFPRYFGSTSESKKMETQHSTQTVESGVSHAPRSAKTGIDSLPKEARDLADILKRTTKNFSVDAYVRQYKLING